MADLLEALNRWVREALDVDPDTYAPVTPAAPPAGIQRTARSASQSDASDDAGAAAPAGQQRAGQPAATAPALPPARRDAPEPEHGKLWWWLHDHGLAKTQHEQAEDLRRAYAPPVVVLDADGNPLDVAAMSDEEVLALNKRLRGLPIAGPLVPGSVTADPNVADVLKDAKPGKQSKPGMGSNQFNKPGGEPQANADFDKMAGGRPVKDYGNGIRSVELADGTSISVRPGSTQGSPTVQITPPSGNPIKIRYQ